MPLCTAVLAAALLSGPAAVPPDPDPSGTRVTTGKDNATPHSASGSRPASLPGTASQAGQFPFTLPLAPPWMAPGGTDGKRNDTAAAEAPPSESAASGASATPVAYTGRPAAAEDEEAAGRETRSAFVPVIDPKTRDVFIRPVFAPGKPGEPITFRPVQGVQTAKSYPPPGRTQKAANHKKARQKPAHSRRHQWPPGW
ncbi:MAG: hypothetical protein IRZ07_25300 [Microbispora sp.]|nr:hypothetical protein [Microbispora sp.]